MVQIKWLSDAKKDLKEIYDYISIDSKRYARLQVEKIKHVTEILKTQPEIGKVLEELEKPSIRELVAGNYRIIYRIVDLRTVHILMVHHSARDLHRRIKR
ncbi:MAG: type II toxin-antitoxin system RelE/ParE family toxin [Aequorivita sp.]